MLKIKRITRATLPNGHAMLGFDPIELASEWTQKGIIRTGVLKRSEVV